jgi:membrane protein YqaA with SNARE-associated domain
MEAWVEWGYLGLFLASFLAATVLPFSSEVVLALMLAGPFSPVGILIAATAGNWLGGVSSYGLGYLAKWDWIEKYLRTKREDVYRFKYRIERYGSVLAFFTWLPFIGDLLALALGVFRVRWPKVFVWMLIGKFLRYLLIVLGFEALFL